MKKIKTSVSLVILFIIILIIFNFTIDVKSNGIYKDEKYIGNSNSDDIIFFEDFDDYPTDLRVTNWFTDFAIYKGVGQLILHTAFRFTYFNSNLNTEPQYKFNNMTVKARTRDRDYGKLRIGKGSYGWGF